MPFVADFHIYTVASGHAYSAAMEIAKAASEKGLSIDCPCDHGPSMPGAPHVYYFNNQFAVPAELLGP